MTDLSQDAGSTTPADMQSGHERFLRHHMRQDCVFEAGSPGRCMYVVVAGSVEIHQGSGAARQLVSTIGPGGIFGEMALLGEGLRNASATIAETPTVLGEIDRARFMYLVGQQPAFALAVMRALARKVPVTAA